MKKTEVRSINGVLRYQTAQETDEKRKRSLEKMVATELLKLAMETAPETEDERRARLEYLSDNPIYIPNNLYLILIVVF